MTDMNTSTNLQPQPTTTNNRVPHIALRTEGDLIEANERITNAFLDGSIEAGKAVAIAKLLKAQKELITDLPLKKLNLLAKLQSKNISVPEKLLNGFIGSGS